MGFDKLAERKNARLRLAITGPAGAGKTFSALLMAKELGAKIGVLDSERESASKYAGETGIPPFYHEPMEEHSIQTYLEKIEDAAAHGIDVLIIDSYSHSWAGRGGALDTVDKMGGWTRAGKVVTPLVQSLIDAILSYPGHVIATMRSKVEHAIEKDAQGKTTVKKLGLAPVAREGTDFEFDVVVDIETSGAINVSKSRCSALAKGRAYVRDRDIPKIAKALKAWLSAGSPISARDAMADRIRFTKSETDLTALMPELKALSDEDRAALKPVFMARKAEFKAAADA